jgi:large subunit ribosomal protein L21
MRSKIGALVAGVVAAASAAGATRWATRRRGATKPKPARHRSTAKPGGEATPAAEASTRPTAAPSAEAESGGAGVDDLTAIKGLGAVTAGKLAALGITSFSEIAAWTPDDLARIGPQINVSPGRIKREEWVGQAKARLEG